MDSIGVDIMADNEENLSKTEIVNNTLDLGSKYVQNQKVVDGLPAINEEHEANLEKYSKDLRTSGELALKFAEVVSASAMLRFAAEQEGQRLNSLPNAQLNNQMDFMLPININTGKCDASALQNLLIKQNSKNCETVAQVGVMSSPQTSWAIGVNIPLGR
jgi:hypothetical protein